MFTSTIRRDDPLVGRIWSTGEHRFVTEDELRARVAAADLVLVGEKHDNPDHQRLEARVVSWSRARTLVIEMIEADHDVSGVTTSDEIATAADWAQTGWPPFDQYRPIFDAALGANMRIVPGNVPTRSIMALARRETLPPETATLLADILSAPEPDPAIAQEMATEMREAHCGLLPERAMNSMAHVQWLRDELMATRMSQNVPAVLVAGAGHVRNDRGVPLHLVRLLATARPLTIAIREVGEGDLAQETLPYDFVWLTPIATDEDPCASLREHAAHREP